MSISIEGLNENQRRAVEWGEGPVLVLAGPGSGKTAVLTLRAARLLDADEDASILALTFTDKAAREMRERVDSLLGRRADRAHLCTFHSFATDVLRQHGKHVGLRPDFSMATTEEDRLAALEDAVAALGVTAEPVPDDRTALLRLIDRLFADAYDGDDSLPSLHDSPSWLPSLFRGYCSQLAAANRLDFGALLHFARKLLTGKPAVANLLRTTWTHFCVDEFQDTNKAQYDLLRALVGDGGPNLFVVADDDQVIYQWNGASPERLQTIKSDYGMTVIQLPENYRCPKVIIDLANSLISHNRLRSPDKQPLVAHRSEGTEGVLWYGTYQSEAEEAAAIPAEIRRRGLRPADCVVIARSAKLLERAAGALRGDGFDAHLTQRKNEFDTPPVKWMYNALRLANARHDRDALRRLCVAWKDLSGEVVEVEDLAAASALVGGDFLRAWCDGPGARASDPAEAELMARARERLAERLDFLDLVEWFMDDWIAPWLEDAAVRDEVETWRHLHVEILAERGRDNATLNLYLQEMDLRSKAPPPPDGAVRCLTVHGSKGLEFRHVFLIGMAEEVFPSFQAVKKGPQSREMEEERRNCFVAITRVRETLTILRSTRYNGWAKQPSRFISEMGLDAG